MSFASTVAGLFAGPLVLGAVWSRLSGMKVLGVEIALADVKVSSLIAIPDINPSIAPAEDAPTSEVVCSPATRPSRDMIDSIEAVIRSKAKIMEVNLGNGDAWWSTRLFLLAALLDDFSDVEQIAFLKSGEERRFVTMAPPRDVRRALASLLSIMESSYHEVRAGGQSTSGSLREIAEQWTGKRFGEVGEFDAKQTMSATKLMECLGQEPGSVGNSVKWDGPLDSPLLGYLIASCDARYVVLIRGGRLNMVIDRFALTSSIAEHALRAHLEG